VDIYGWNTNNTRTVSPKSTFEIKGEATDASASSTVEPLESTSVTFSASATYGTTPINNIKLTFEVFISTNLTSLLASGTVITAGLGVAEATITLPGNLIPGVYTVRVSNGCTVSYGYLTIYDPNSNFVTGGRWINSIAGAYVADATLIGKANFGFVSKYKKGNNQVDGNTEFQFKAGNF
jgi:hypothetical protein